ncbi:hypothetical protein BJA5080_06988 [Bradyrhizobium diazoefficiens SEMIA 5080]|uniref:Secreted protein n=1 Tax=Bradyrhizobium diazoefficiens SEMIA 5080 TaxID=754504 RepID=A0A837CMJ7_9BRAD|nr:hypothetical protein BJA5080_06988 [Bradyrhizobium diazoefficiens SEMIA 5080]
MLIDPNFVLSLLPMPFTTVMTASAMPAAMSPYSIAVAPRSSARKFFKVFFIVAPSLCRWHACSQITCQRRLEDRQHVRWLSLG